MTTKNVRITKSIVDTKYAPMINVDITGTTIVKDTAMTITAIGAPGTNGTSTQENTQTYTNREDITGKMHI